MNKREFMMAYTLLRAVGNIANLGGKEAMEQAERAWDYLEKVAPK